MPDAVERYSLAHIRLALARDVDRPGDPSDHLEYHQPLIPPPRMAVVEQTRLRTAVHNLSERDLTLTLTASAKDILPCRHTARTGRREIALVHTNSLNADITDGLAGRSFGMVWVVGVSWMPSRDMALFASAEKGSRDPR